MVIAIATELESVLNAFGGVDNIEKEGSYEVYVITRGRAVLYIVVSGAGEIAAAAATQMLITRYKTDAILNFGFVGAINDCLQCQQVVLVRDMVHYDADTSAIDNVPAGRYLDFDDIFVPFDTKLLKKTLAAFPSLQTVRAASGDTFIASGEKKQQLREMFSADICDMESAGILLTAARNNIPALSLKVVSDNADESSPISFIEIAYNGTKACAAILAEIVDELSNNPQKNATSVSGGKKKNSGKA